MARTERPVRVVNVAHVQLESGRHQTQALVYVILEAYHRRGRLAQIQQFEASCGSSGR